MRKIKGIILGTVMASLLGGAVHAADNVKIAFIDPLSGGFAATGEDGLAQYRFAAEELVNKNGGVLGGAKFEIVPFDNKISPK
jgi:branched-chain amino acid transport system substrate-binding protein